MHACLCLYHLRGYEYRNYLDELCIQRHANLIPACCVVCRMQIKRLRELLKSAQVESSLLHPSATTEYMYGGLDGSVRSASAAGAGDISALTAKNAALRKAHAALHHHLDAVSSNASLCYIAVATTIAVAATASADPFLGMKYCAVVDN